MQIITNLEVGTLVHGINGYSRVETCVHGNKYYAYVGEDVDDCEIAVEVLDDDEDHITCCS